MAAPARAPRLAVDNLRKAFDLRTVIPPLSFELGPGECLGITGANGAGKSTLTGLMASLIEPSSGTVRRELDGVVLAEDDYPAMTGFVAPYLTLYPEYTPSETVGLISDLRGSEIDPERALRLGDELEIVDRFDERIGTFSSGMKQRVKYVVALMHQPTFLFIDEPMSNLDEAGKRIVMRLLAEESGSRITVIATNDPPDLALCTSRIDLDHTPL